MKCDLCQNKASVFYTQVTDGDMTKSSWCADCAEAQGVTDPTGLHLLNLLTEEHGGAGAGGLSTDEECAKCGFSLDDLQKIGRLGCPACYKNFRQILAVRIEGMHRGVKHSGRVPQGMALQQQGKMQLEELENELQEAVLAENFEEAARLRDELKSAQRKMA